MPTMSKVQAIKTFFETPPHARPVSRQEFIDLNRDKAGYEEVAQDCAKALGVELEVPKKD